MQTADHVRQVMSEVGPLLELAEVSEAEGGTAWALRIDENSVVFAELDEANDRLVLTVDVGMPTEANRGELLETLLAYSGQWMRTGGIRMVLDEPGGRVVQMFDLAAVDLEVTRFAGVLVNFVDIAAGWRKVVSDERPISAAGERESGSLPSPDMRV